mgnify:CR=1 FL=1
MTSAGRSNLIMGGILFLGLLVGAGSVYFFIVTRHTALNKELLQQATRQSELAREKAKLAEELSLKQKRANEQTTLLKQVREAHLAYLAWKWDKLLDQKHVENVFSKAFQKAGLKPEMTLQESLIAVKESSIKAELAVLMDLQAALLNREQDRTLARALDDDADRAKIRDWLQNKQKEPLEKFSQSLDFTRASVQTVTWLIHALDVMNSKQSQPILQRARG